MSRHTTQHNKFHYAWGYDHPLSSYFFQKFRDEPKEGEEECVFSIDSYFTTEPHPDFPNKTSFTNSEILEIMEAEGDVVPSNHLDQIALDLPF